MTSCQRSSDGRFIRNRLDTTRPTALNRLSRSLSSSCCAIAAPASAHPEIDLRGIWPSRGGARQFGSLRSLLLDDFHDGRDLIGRDPPPLPFRPTSHDPEFEGLVQPDGPVIVAQSIGKKGQRQLSRSAPAVSPAKSGRGMVEQVQPQRQWLGFLAVADGDNGLSGTGLPVGYADISFAGHHFCSIEKVQDRTVERRGVATALCAAVRNFGKAQLVVAGLPGRRRQYSSANMIVITRLVTDGSAGSGEWYVRLSSK